jgi:hypothetical protein
VTSGGYAGAGGARESNPGFVKRVVSISHPGASADLVGVPTAVSIHIVHLLDIQQDTAGIVGDEVLIAVATGPNGRPKAGFDRLLKSLCDIVCTLANLYPANGLRLGGRPAKIIALPQALEVGVILQNGGRHASPIKSEQSPQNYRPQS